MDIPILTALHCNCLSIYFLSVLITCCGGLKQAAEELVFHEALVSAIDTINSLTVELSIGRANRLRFCRSVFAQQQHVLYAVRALKTFRGGEFA